MLARQISTRFFGYRLYTLPLRLNIAQNAGCRALGIVEKPTLKRFEKFRHLLEENFARLRRSRTMPTNWLVPSAA